MKISIQEMAEKIKSANSFIVSAHINPDGDALGSVLGMMHILKSMKKNVRAIIDDKAQASFSFLPGIDLLEKPRENEDKYEADYLLLLDVSLDRCGAVLEKCKGMTVLNIDHHISNDDVADFLLLDEKAASTTEIVALLAEELGVELSKDAAICLYTGMVTDTGYFAFSNTTPRTMRLAAQMLEKGVSPEIVSEALEVCPYAHVQDLSTALQTVELTDDGKVIGIFLDYEAVKDMDSTDGFIGQIRIVDGVEIAVVLTEKKPNVCKASIRSKGVNVSVIAQSFGGGGHIRAAGCTIEKPFGEAKAIIMQAIREALR